MAQNRYSIDSLKIVLEKEAGRPLSSAASQMLKLAFQGHAGQFRESVNKDQKIPYIVHPVGVAALVIKHFDSVKKYLKEDLDTIIMAALAHDLLEDTRITRDQIKSIGGERVERLVEAMTKLPSPSHSNYLKRNEEITNRTLAAGPAAVYIRACDSMHNLSWPRVTPIKVLMRGIVRAKEVYLPLLSKVKIGEEMKGHFESKISAAEEYIKSGAGKNIHAFEIPNTIGEAINTCAIFTHKKILEVHDIVEILQNITGADNISTWSPHGKTEGFFKLSLSSGTQKKFASDIKESQIDFVAQELLGNGARNFIQNTIPSGRYFILTLRISVTCRYLILLSFEKAAVPSWASITNLEFLIDSLSERLIVANGDYKRSLVAVASNLNMRFEVDWADRLVIEPANLVELQKWQKRCAQAIRQVLHACEIFFEQEAEKSPLRDLVKVESRVKDTPSIIRKFLPPSHLEWPHFNALPDIAGVRIICPTKKWVLNLKKYLLGTKVRALGIKAHGQHQMKDYTKNPTQKGYRALHLVLAVDTFLDKKKIAVPCEIQIHTMVQDIWAKIAHKITYKHDETSAAFKAMHHQLRDIGENLDNFDHLVDTITDLQSKTDPSKK